MSYAYFAGRGRRPRDLGRQQVRKLVAAQTEQNAMKLSKEHIAEEWDEGHPENGGDGYWVALKTGWKWAGDAVGSVHTIHEDTQQQAHAETVMRCQCKDCQKPKD